MAGLAIGSMVKEERKVILNPAASQVADSGG